MQKVAPSKIYSNSARTSSVRDARTMWFCSSENTVVPACDIAASAGTALGLRERGVEVAKQVLPELGHRGDDLER